MEVKILSFWIGADSASDNTNGKGRFPIPSIDPFMRFTQVETVRKYFPIETMFEFITVSKNLTGQEIDLLANQEVPSRTRFE